MSKNNNTNMKLINTISLNFFLFFFFSLIHLLVATSDHLSSSSCSFRSSYSSSSPTRTARTSWPPAFYHSSSSSPLDHVKLTTAFCPAKASWMQSRMRVGWGDRRLLLSCFGTTTTSTISSTTTNTCTRRGTLVQNQYSMRRSISCGATAGGGRRCHPTNFVGNNPYRRNSIAGARAHKKNTLLTMVATDEDSDFMTLLQSRINHLKDNENKIPLVVLDCMLPRQILRIEANDNMLLNVVKHQMYKKENPTFGMLGTVSLNAWEKVHLKTGVEVEIIEKPNHVLGKGVMLELKAKRRFVIVSGHGDDDENNAGDEAQVKITNEGWSEATVKYLNSNEQEQMELAKSNDTLCIERAIEKAKELTLPNNPKLMSSNDNVVNNGYYSSSLVGRWIELAREKQKHVGQIDRLLDDIGKIPPENEPSECAFWVGALINPLPSMGLSMDIRPALLTATTAEKRVDIARDAILKSIRHMEGTEILW